MANVNPQAMAMAAQQQCKVMAAEHVDEITRSYYDAIPGFADHDTPGIAQLEELKAFAKAEGKDWTDPKLQARFTLSKMRAAGDATDG